MVGPDYYQGNKPECLTTCPLAKGNSEALINIARLSRTQTGDSVMREVYPDLFKGVLDRILNKYYTGGVPYIIALKFRHTFHTEFDKSIIFFYRDKRLWDLTLAAEDFG